MSKLLINRVSTLVSNHETNVERNRGVNGLINSQSRDIDTLSKAAALIWTGR